MNVGPLLSQAHLLSSVKAQAVVRPSLTLSQDAVDGFAGEVVRRASQAPAGAEGRTVDDTGLYTAVENAVGYVKDTFGNDAARAVMGIVLGKTGQGALTESDLGDGFVSALQFIDRTFGTAQGDKAISFFNGELNQALNGYFQNGQDEQFLALDLESAQASAGSAVQTAVSQFMDKAQAGSADPASTLFDQAQSDLDKELPPIVPVDSLGQSSAEGGTTGGGTTLTDDTAASRGGDLSSRVRRRLGRTTALKGYAAPDVSPGVVLDSSV